MNKKDLEILEKYAKVMFGCSYDDLDDKEAQMLIYYVSEREPEFLNHRGVEF